MNQKLKVRLFVLTDFEEEDDCKMIAENAEMMF